MSGRTVFCVKFQKEMPGLDVPPGRASSGSDLRERLGAGLEALEERQKMILNEYRIMPWQKKARKSWTQLEQFFFGEARRRRLAIPEH